VSATAEIVVYVDGLCEPVNPGGTATYGYVVRNDAGRDIARKSGVVGKGTGMSNNVAEYAALCEALRYLIREKMTLLPVEIRSDSRLLVNQMKGEWKFHKGLYAQEYKEAKGSRCSQSRGLLRGDEEVRQSLISLQSFQLGA